MKRNLERLANQKFDVLVVGGGIHGAITAWDAALRGLSVALIERKQQRQADNRDDQSP